MADSKRTTARWLIGLTTFALLVGAFGIAVVWAFSYGPLG